jgi:hypothetical protein
VAKEVRANFDIDASELRAFAKALQKAAPAAKKELTLRLRALGEHVADDAQARIQEWSRSIPPSIRVRVYGANVQVIASAMPLAGLLEFGSKGRENSDTFKHPVFGNAQVWVDQPKHEFLKPAAAANQERIELEGLAAIDAALEMLPRG